MENGLFIIASSRAELFATLFYLVPYVPQMLPNYWECPSCKRVSLVRSASPIAESDNPEAMLLHEETHRTGYVLRPSHSSDSV